METVRVRHALGNPTLEDVAARAGVSRATASRAINGLPMVNVRTRRRVLDAMHELGYRPNRAAAYLVTRRSRQVALLVCEAARRDDRALARAVRDMSTELSAEGLTCLVRVVGGDDDPVEVVRQLRATGVDGAVVVAWPGAAGAPIVELLDTAAVPVVVAHAPTQHAGTLVTRLLST